MFFARELQPSVVYLSPQAQGLFIPSERSIRVRKIALVFLCISLVLLDHHATLRFATASGSVRPLREIAVVLVEVILIFLCFVAFFTLAVYPIFNHTVTFRLHN